jgi:hypothetical protein
MDFNKWEKRTGVGKPLGGNTRGYRREDDGLQ